MRVKENTRANRSGDYSYKHEQTTSTHAHENARTREKSHHAEQNPRIFPRSCIFSQKNLHISKKNSIFAKILDVACSFHNAKAQPKKYFTYS